MCRHGVVVVLTWLSQARGPLPAIANNRVNTVGETSIYRNSGHTFNLRRASGYPLALQVIRAIIQAGRCHVGLILSVTDPFSWSMTLTAMTLTGNIDVISIRHQHYVTRLDVTRLHLVASLAIWLKGNTFLRVERICGGL